VTETSRRLEDLHPMFQPIAREILELAQNRITAKFPGSIVRPATTWRSMTDQAIALAAGKLKVRMGWHQVGLALDAAVITPEGLYVRDGKDERYTIFGLAAIEHGCVWGGSWQRFPDPPHAEYHPGFSFDQYLAWLKEHPVVTT
jgi:hypothetical protein